MKIHSLLPKILRFLFSFDHSIGLIVLILTFLYIAQHQELANVVSIPKQAKYFLGGEVGCIAQCPELANVASKTRKKIGRGGGKGRIAKVKCHSEPKSNFSHQANDKYMSQRLQNQK